VGGTVGRVAIAIGANLGDRRTAVAFAVERLAALIDGLTLSDLIETEPDGEGLQDQPLYLNAVVVGETALTPRRLLIALQSGAVGVLGVCATTATAGIIVGVVTLTGLGLKISGIIVSAAGGTLILTVLYSALAVWLLGLAVPVTASYIIAAVMVAPALVASGVPLAAAHMFIFYYAVLSEVSPPTALSPFAAAAITGGNPFQTMMLTWKYTLPAFLVPFVFTLTAAGTGILFIGTAAAILVTAATAALGIAALAVALTGWLTAPVSGPHRALFGAGGLLLCYAASLADALGIGLTALVAFLHFFGRSRSAGAEIRS